MSQSIDHREPDCLGGTPGRSRQICDRRNVILVYAVPEPEQPGSRQRGRYSIVEHATAYDACELARTSCEMRIRRASLASSVARFRQARVAIAPRMFITMKVSKAA